MVWGEVAGGVRQRRFRKVNPYIYKYIYIYIYINIYIYIYIFIYTYIFIYILWVTPGVGLEAGRGVGPEIEGRTTAP